VAICRLKRVAADHKGDVRSRMPALAPRNGMRVACVGAGPASLTVARDLVPLGYEVTVFDGEAQAGGFIRSQIPRFRLPEAVIDEETGYILELGVTFRGGERTASMKALLAERCDAIFIGCGAPHGRDLNIPGRQEAAAHIHIGIDWLVSVAFPMSPASAAASSCSAAATRRWTAAARPAAWAASRSRSSCAAASTR